MAHASTKDVVDALHTLKLVVILLHSFSAIVPIIVTVCGYV